MEFYFLLFFGKELVIYGFDSMNAVIDTSFLQAYSMNDLRSKVAGSVMRGTDLNGVSKR